MKCFSFASRQSLHEGQSLAEVGCTLLPAQAGSCGSTAPLHCGWAPACTQLRKVFLLAGMAINRALLEPRGDGHPPVHSVLKDKHATISLILVPSFWVSSIPCLVGCQDDWFYWGLLSISSLQATAALQRKLKRRADFCTWGHRQCHRYLSEA